MLFACASPLVESLDGDVRRLEGTITTRGSGFAKVDIDVGDEQALMFTVQPVRAGDLVHVWQLVDPDGEVVFDAEEWFAPNDEQKTAAGFLSPVSSLNWPVSSDDQGLVPGRWTARFGLTDSDLFYVKGDVDVDVLLKDDADFDEGLLRIALLRPEDEDPGLEVALDQAKQIWADLYAQIGLTLQFEDWVTPFDDLARPTVGDPRYVEIAATTGIRTVVVVLVDEIDTSGLSLSPNVVVVGLAGGIPGAAVPSSQTAVQIGTRDLAGPDGRFEGEEIRLFAETMAHETAHYLGLFHPVEEFVDVPFTIFDALGDTPRCSTETRCQELLASNLMYPRTVCADDGLSCVPQDSITVDQASVLQRYAGVD